jgi:tRNA threonylcarbamoyladenosine biosynthesis protein TsaB
VRALAVDTTSALGSVAVAGPAGVLAEARVSTPDGHSRWILPAAAALLGGLGLDAAAIDVFAVATGPGSFTGLRVGLGSVQGLALAAGRPCVGMSTLDLLAEVTAGSSSTIVVLLDAFRGEVYSGVYDGGARPRGAPCVAPLKAVLERLPAGSAFVGEAVREHREAIRAAVAGAVFPESPAFLAGPLAAAALRLAAAGATVPPSGLRPLYLRGADVRPARP